MRLISKKSVLRILQEEPSYCDTQNAITEIYDKINELPTIEERKTGKWIEHDDFDNSWECSVCNEVVDIIEGTPMDNEYRFCPWCGAKMEGGAE